MKAYLFLVLLVGCSAPYINPNPPLMYPDGSFGAALRCVEEDDCYKEGWQVCSIGYQVVKTDRPQKQAPYYWLLVRCK